MRAPATRADRDAVRAIAANIAALPDTSDEAVYVPLVLAIFAGVSPARFEIVDNAIGSASRAFDFGGRGHLVRRVRNHHGRELFAVLKGAA